MIRRAGISLTVGLAAMLVALIIQGQEQESTGERVRRSSPEPIRAASPDAISADGSLAPLAPEIVLGSPLYHAGEGMVRLHDPAVAQQVADDYGMALRRAPGRSGYALFAGDPLDLAALMDDSRVALVAPNGISRGSSMVSAQWHLGEVASSPPAVPGDWVVAVLDTGVAYETANRLGIDYVQAPSLAASAIVAPWDFVNDDAHANDDHQHGTHIASIIASSGDVSGIVPGVSLMPVKVLDANNVGSEFALIEGIHHAVDYGADVVNLSLSFGKGFQPSLGLQQALQTAADAGVVMVAASGNDALDFTSWPAASPLVIAVGASTPEKGKKLTVSGYSNGNGAVDVLAPGGDIDRDMTKDGYPDGILAESIHPDDPTRLGYWMMAGTSQATAIATGVAVQALDWGVPPEDAYVALQQLSSGGDWSEGTGAGFLEWTLGDTCDAPRQVFHATILPFLAMRGPTVAWPAALVTAFHADGTPASEVWVGGSIWGNDDGTAQCHTDALGQCILYGTSVAVVDGKGDSIPMAWAFTLDVVEGGGISHHPRAAMTTNAAFEDLVAGIRAAPDLDDGLIAWSWADGDVVGWDDIMAGTAVVDLGAGMATSPFAVLATPAAIEGSLTSTSVAAGDHQVAIDAIHLDGTGFASLPLGYRDVTMLALGARDPILGLDAEDVHGAGDTVVPLDGAPSFDRGTGDPVSLVGSSLADQLAEGGWTVEGYGGAAALATHSALAIAPGQVLFLDGSGAGAVEVVD